MAGNGLEFEHTEKPLIEQLTSMPGTSWRHVHGVVANEFQPKDPHQSFRSSFEESILEKILRDHLKKLNVNDDGQPWLDDDRVSQAVAALTRGTVAAGNSLLAANEAATRLLLEGTTVPGLLDSHGGRAQPVHYIDWQHPERNDFLAISQFRMNVPGTQGREYLVPDIVLFVNGIPLVVIECKKPVAADGALHAAIDQLRRDANQDGANRGSDRLFRTVQLTVATTMDDARLGTFTSRRKDYNRWNDPYPYSRNELATVLGRSGPNAAATLQPQETLTATVLYPDRLLDIVQNFVVFRDVDVADGETRRVKLAPRHQQYRAVGKAVDRLLNRETKAVHGKQDQRGGIIWHTQGSGKSLTMVFLVRKMRATPQLAEFKVVIVTDRRDLQKQLRATASLSGEKVDVVQRAAAVPAVLSRQGASQVFVMIQKQQDTESARQNATESLAHDRSPGWGQINTSDAILILVDEAHRSHGSKLHTNLMQSLPNAARIGFTGTPIIMDQRKLTSTTFGEYIDQYRLGEAEEDEAIVPVIYEGRISNGVVSEPADLDTAMSEDFPPMSDEEFDELARIYAKSPDVLSAPEMVKRKAKDMLRHYVACSFTEGFKAQVVAYSRSIAVGFRDALQVARDELVVEAETHGPRLKEKLNQLEGDEKLSERDHVRLAAYSKLKLLKAIDFVPVISPADGDPRDWEEWTKTTNQDDAVDEFLKPFPDEADLSEESKPVAMLIVRTMLLTGFDAPLEQVMYLDRRMKEAELLQAIARVNRTEERKAAGFVVDYAGVAKHLSEALAAYAADDVERVTINFDDEADKLEGQRNALRMLFEAERVTPDATDLRSMEPAVQLLADERLRVEFVRSLREFLKTLNLVMPRTEADDFLADARLFGTIATAVRYRYAEERGFDPADHGQHVRDLISRHIFATGIMQKIPPIRITAPKFAETVGQQISSRAKASAMHHALRNHIGLHIGEDPVAYSRLREHLQNVLEKYATDFDKQAEEFGKLVQQAIDLYEGQLDDLPEQLRGLSPLEHALYRLLTDTLTDGVIDDETCGHFIGIAIEVERQALHASAKPDFWRNNVALGAFRTHIYRMLVRDAALRQTAGTMADEMRDIVYQHRREVRAARAT